MGPVAFRHACQLYSHTYLSGERGCNAKIFSSLVWNFLMSTVIPVLGIQDVYPGSLVLAIADPGSKNSNKREGGRKFVVLPFFVATNITKLKLILFLNRLVMRKIWANLKRILELLIKKIVIKLSKIWFGIRDPGSGKNLFFETLFIIPLTPWIS